MHAAKLERSKRLQRVEALLRRGGKWSTMDIMQRCKVCAVNSIVSELRQAGHTIHCKREGNRFLYWMEGK